MAKACIICGQVVEKGHPVEDDLVIRSIRGAKQALGIARNNELVVSEECMEDYKKRRAKYEKDLVMHIVLAGGVLVVFAFLPIFTSGFSLTAVLLGLLLAGMIMVLSAFNHCPKVAGAEAKQPAVLSAAKRKMSEAKKGKKR